jgi:hypothetical protein
MSKDTVTVTFDIFCGPVKRLENLATDHEYALLKKGDTVEIFHSKGPWSANYTVFDAKKLSVGSINYDLRLSDVRLTCVTDGHNKEWRAQVMDGFKVVVRWGKIGGTLQSKERQFSSISATIQFVHEMIEEKTSKGYQ